MAERDGDRLLRGLCGGGGARFLAVEAAGVAEHARVLHDLGPDAAATAAECMVANLLLSAYVKGEERLTLQVQAERPAFSFIGDADAEGGIRARLRPLDLRRPGGAPVRGAMLVMKADLEREIYRGVTAIEDDPLDRALAAHLAGSQQVGGIVVRIDVVAGEDGRIERASGVLVERLPEEPGEPSLAPDRFRELFAPLEERHAAAALDEIEGVLRLAGTEARVLERRAPHWRCSCSRERVEAVLASLPAEDLRAMADEDHGAEVTCHFCNLTWRVTEERLRELLAAAEERGGGSSASP